MIIIIINQNILSLMDRFAYLHLLCSEDVVSILVEVTHDVSQKIGKTEEGQYVAQIPESIVRLTKKFFLHPMNSKV